MVLVWSRAASQLAYKVMYRHKSSVIFSVIFIYLFIFHIVILIEIKIGINDTFSNQHFFFLVISGPVQLYFSQLLNIKVWSFNASCWLKDVSS